MPKVGNEFKIVTQYITFSYILQYFNTQLYLLLLYWFIVIRFKKAGKWYICAQYDSKYGKLFGSHCTFQS